MLFNFPSRYLSAIGLATVFSLRWSLPPALGCIPKQPDSEKTRSGRGKRPYGPDTRHGTRPRSEGHRRSPSAALGLPYVTFRRAQKARRFDAGQFPIHSPLLRESLLVSLPPLNNMLKFSGCSRLNSGRNRDYLSLGRRRRQPRPVRSPAGSQGSQSIARPTRARLAAEARKRDTAAPKARRQLQLSATHKPAAGPQTNAARLRRGERSPGLRTRP